MCNPPFYSSAEEVEAGLEAKELEPFAVSSLGGRESYSARIATNASDYDRYVQEG